MRLIEQTPQRMGESLGRLVPQSIVPLNPRGQRRWSAMENKALVSYARWKIASEDITGRARLADADSGLYDILMRRKLLDKLGLPSTRKGIRDWAAMSDEDTGFLCEDFHRAEWD